MIHFFATLFVLGAAACVIKAMLFLWKTEQEPSVWLQDLRQNLCVMGGLLGLAGLMYLLATSWLLSLVFVLLVYAGLYVGRVLERYFSFAILEDFVSWALGGLSVALIGFFIALWEKPTDPQATLFMLFALISVSASCVTLIASLKPCVPEPYIRLFYHEEGWNTRKVRIGLTVWLYAMSLTMATYYPNLFSSVFVMVSACLMGATISFSIPTEFGIHYMFFGQCTLGVSTLFLGLAHHQALLTFIGAFVALSGLWLSRKSWGKASMYAYMIWNKRTPALETSPIISLEEVAQKIQDAERILVIPGKGFIDANAHFLLTQCLEFWEQGGKKVSLYASPYAGRMPNILPLLFHEAQLPQHLWCTDPLEEGPWDLVLVLGANDLVNPALKNIQTLCEPLLLTDMTEDIVFMRREKTLSTGYWEVENPLLRIHPTLAGCFHQHLRYFLEHFRSSL